MFEPDFLVSRMMIFVPLLLSLSVHEWAHAWSAHKLGDDTALHEGRMTLNPLSHIDPIGTVLLPLMGVPFGWAKPVPVNPVCFKHSVTMRQGMMITAVAGPISNVVLGVASMLVVAVLMVFQPGPAEYRQAFQRLFEQLLVINTALAVFNMLPIFPLDGSRVADALMPRQLRPQWEQFQRIGPIALICVLILPRMLGFSLFSWAFRLVNLVLVALIHLLVMLRGLG